MPTIQQGSIVLAEVSDPNGRNRKARPLAILNPDDQIVPGELLQAVAITSTAIRPLQPSHVALPWFSSGHARTGLKIRSWANCDWRVEIFDSDILKVVGTVPRREMLEILSRFAPPSTEDASPTKPHSAPGQADPTTKPQTDVSDETN